MATKLPALPVVRPRKKQSIPPVQLVLGLQHYHLIAFGKMRKQCEKNARTLCLLKEKSACQCRCKQKHPPYAGCPCVRLGATSKFSCWSRVRSLYLVFDVDAVLKPAMRPRREPAACAILLPCFPTGMVGESISYYPYMLFSPSSPSHRTYYSTTLSLCLYSV